MRPDSGDSDDSALEIVAVRVTGFTGPLDLSPDDGSLHADVASRQVRARAESGSVRLGLSRVPGRVDMGGDDGSLTVLRPRTTGASSCPCRGNPRGGHRVTAGSADGKVTVDTVN
ncbi:hypothetical protein [Streptomyces sp. SUK 48]|uniref:hypothetical protein n=1 Tax=Streptomyces sp. SUK 48 TaxID=2582831 RepID=UPI00129AD49C|nr:hypothetical protein [Streptomyces sp. SUK 48]